jgi:hypothetical protein
MTNSHFLLSIISGKFANAGELESDTENAFTYQVSTCKIQNARLKAGKLSAFLPQAEQLSGVKSPLILPLLGKL